MTLALYYDLQHQQYDQDLPYWLSLAHSCGEPLLELGCGSGRVTLPLAQAGHTVYGLDNDPYMLHVLRGKLAPDLDVRLLLADMTSYRLAVVFPLIVMPCNTYSTLTTAERLAAIEHIKTHLSPNGLFAFSMPNPVHLAELPPEGESELEHILLHPISGHPLQVSSGWLRSEEAVVLRWHYDHLLPDGRAERLTAEVIHYLTGVIQIQREFNLAGFRTILYGDFDKHAYDQDSPLLLCEAYLV